MLDKESKFEADVIVLACKVRGDLRVPRFIRFLTPLCGFSSVYVCVCVCFFLSCFFLFCFAPCFFVFFAVKIFRGSFSGRFGGTDNGHSPKFDTSLVETILGSTFERSEDFHKKPLMF